MKKQEQIFPGNSNQKRAEMVTVILNKINFTSKIVTRDKIITYFVFLYFGYARSQFLDQGLNPGHSSENWKPKRSVTRELPYIYFKTLKRYSNYS